MRPPRPPIPAVSPPRPGSACAAPAPRRTSGGGSGGPGRAGGCRTGGRAAVTPPAARRAGATTETQGMMALAPVRFDLRPRLVGMARGPYPPSLPLAGRVQGHLDGDVAMKGTLG